MSKFDHIDYSMLPEHMQDSAKLYVERGIEPGSFMLAVLTNNLTEAFTRADHINKDSLLMWIIWLLNECPRSAWGSVDIVEAWMKARQSDVTD